MNLFDKKYVYFVWDAELLGKQGFVANYIDDLMYRVNQQSKDFRCALRSSEDNSSPFACASSSLSASWRFAYYDPNYDCKVAYNEGKQIQYRGRSWNETKWRDSVNPSWDEQFFEYRVKSEEHYYVGIGSRQTLTCDSNRSTYRHVYASFESSREASDWIIAHKKFVPVMRAFEKGLTIEYKYKGVADFWSIALTPLWNTKCRYRVKPNNRCKTTCILEHRRMTNRELAKWLAEGRGQKMEGQNKFVYTTYAYKDGDDEPCREGVRIRSWNETQWREPEV